MRRKFPVRGSIKDSLYLYVPGYQPGLVVEDTRGQQYCVVNNGYGKAGGLRRMNEQDRELAQKLGRFPLKSRTLKEICGE